MLLQNVPLGLTGSFAADDPTKISALTGYWWMDLAYKMEFGEDVEKKNFDHLYEHLVFMMKELKNHLVTACKSEMSAVPRDG